MHGPPAFLLFSGHNDRAVVALCRFFARQGLEVAIVASGPDDLIFQTAYADRVRLVRLDRRVDLALLQAAGALLGRRLVYCPTTEFINEAMLAHRPALGGTALQIGLPDAEVYHRLTSKLLSQPLFEGLAGVRLPRTLAPGHWRAPCVLKPRSNLAEQRVLYPLLCADDAALASACQRPDIEHFFAQEWVQGQSVYLCAYLARDGRHAETWQENLMQQAAGKSIVLARRTGNPGFDTPRLLARLAEAAYHGPLMVEFIREPDGTLAYIETNPRFWGPLQLTLDACPAVLELFAQDHGAPAAALSPERQDAAVYAWWAGAMAPGAVLHPAAAHVPDLPALLRSHDVYRRADSLALHGRH